MTLDDWLSNNKVSAEQFGRSLGVTGEAVRNWRSGKRFPETMHVEAIIKATNGAVTANDLHAACLSQSATGKAA